MHVSRIGCVAWKRRDIHKYGVALELADKRLHNPVSKRNAEVVRRFERALLSEGLTPGRVVKYLAGLKTLAEHLVTDFEDATKEDIEDLMLWVERSDYSPWTKHDFKVVIKRFYKWLRGNNEDYPPEVKWIRTTLKEKDVLLPEQLITEDEIKRMVEAAENPRDRAFIIALYESGARIGEIGSMNVGDVFVSPEGQYAKLRLRGKTGSREVIVVASLPYLAQWLSVHPKRSNPEAPLWVGIGTVSHGQALGYPALAKILKVTARRAGIQKRIHPHKLRHSRATFLANKLTEAQLSAVFGWTQGSAMPRTYVHLSGRDTDDALLGVYGLKKRVDSQPKVAPKSCPRCSALNAMDALFCVKCGLALDVRAAREVDTARAEADHVMNELIRDKEFREFLQRKMREHGLI
jgi:site-specific recombinase XerD/ribosomal protein L40E